MKTESKEKIVMPRLYSQENKVNIMKEMLGKLLNQDNPFLYERENNVLRWILVDDLGIKEVAEKFQLTTTRTNQLFNNAVKRINSHFSNIYSTIKQAQVMEKQIEQMSAKLKKYELKKDAYSKLSLKTKDLLKKNITDVDFSVRLQTVLRYGNIYTVSELVRLQKNELKRFRGAGEYSVKEAEAFLTQHQLSWGMNFI